MLFSHAIIMQSCYRIPSLHLITCTYYPIVLLSYLVGCTSHLILLKRHFSSMLLSTRILFISLLFFFICITFIRVILFRALFFIRVYFLFMIFHSHTFHSHTFPGWLLYLEIPGNTWNLFYTW